MAAVAAWLSAGMLALATEDGPRIALLPLSVSAATTVAVVALTILLLVRATRRWTPILLLILVLLPWLPVPVPAAPEAVDV